MSKFVSNSFCFSVLICFCLFCGGCGFGGQRPIVPAERLSRLIVKHYRAKDFATERLIRIEADGAVQRFTTFEEYDDKTHRLKVIGLVNIGIKAFTLTCRENNFDYSKNPIFSPLIDPRTIFSDLFTLELAPEQVGEILARRGLIIGKNNEIVWINTSEPYLIYSYANCATSVERGVRGAKNSTALGQHQRKDLELKQQGKESCRDLTIKYVDKDLLLRIRSKQSRVD
jgi:hypothetical protein